MKNTFLLLLLLSSVFVEAQSLKDALFSGKLKNQPGTVIRKGDDLASKMDTAYKVPAADTATTTTGATAATSAQTTNTAVAQTQVATSASVVNTPDSSASLSTGTSVATNTESNETTETPKEAAPKPKDNNAVLKEYMSSFAETLKAEVLSTKKVKKGDYFVQVSYVIETDGKMTVNDVYVDPENSYLQQQIKDRLAAETPQLKPVLNSVGTPRKVNKKYNLTLTKE